MKKDVYTIKNDASIVGALRMMKEKNVSGLPEVNQEDKLVGFIPDGD